jgi:endonuclease/exonuclease/phosphatase family metal-dependent hydrolase
MIDHIFVSSDKLNVTAGVVLRESFDDGRQSSDHDPILVVLSRK